MARIRTIKPEFPESESMGRVSREARLLFIMLWLACDDEGKTRGHSRKLASTLYPYDEDAPKLIDRWLGELERENVVMRYQVDGSTYLKVVAWSKHQKIDKPSKSRLPDPSESDSKQPIREPSRTFSNPPEGHAKHVETLAEVPRTVEEHSRLYLGPRTMDLVPSSDNPENQNQMDSLLVRIQERELSDRPASKAISSKVVRGRRWGADETVPDSWIVDGAAARAKRGYPVIDLKFVAEDFQNYWAAAAGSYAVKVDWKKTWLNRATSVKANGVYANGRTNGQHGKATGAHEFFDEIKSSYLNARAERERREAARH